MPNAGFSFHRGQIYIRALENIDLEEGCNPQEMINISYMNLMDSAANRQNRLLSLYYFTCNCRRCSNPNFDWPLYSMRCQTASCLGKPVFVGVGKAVGELSPKQCSECGKIPKTVVMTNAFTK
jgi:hypothetical protein